MGIKAHRSKLVFTGEDGIMQVNSSNGSLQQRFFSGTGSIGGIHLPDFNDKYVFSKKKSDKSKKIPQTVAKESVKTSATEQGENINK